MKTNFFYLLLIGLLAISAQAQSENAEQSEFTETIVYREVDVMAKYHGGYNVLLKKIEAATKICKRGKFKGKQASVIIEVLVTDKGKVAKVDFVNEDFSLCKDVIRETIEKSNQWVPAIKNNKPVNSYIQFKINLHNGYNNKNGNAVTRLE